MTLIFSAVLSTLSLAALSTHNLEARMASNLADYERARQAAETAVAAGERWLDAQAVKPAAAAGCSRACQCTNGGRVWDSSAVASVGDWWRLDWARSGRSDVGDPAGGIAMTRLAAPPRFLVEYLGDSGLTPVLSYYRVTGFGVGSSSDMIAIVQSTYARAYCCAPERPRRDRRLGRISWRELSPP